MKIQDYLRARSEVDVQRAAELKATQEAAEQATAAVDELLDTIGGAE